MPRPRLRRSIEVPKFAVAELARGESGGMGVLLSDSVVLTLRTNDWKPAGSEITDDPDVVEMLPRQRETIVRLERDGETVAAIRLKQHDVPLGCDLGLASAAWEAESPELETLSATLRAGWQDPVAEVLELGPTIELATIWSQPGKVSPALLANALDAAVEAVSPIHSVVVLKAFPLEYEEWESKDPALGVSFRARRAAMLTYYARHFDMTPFPGPNGEAGWMWRIPSHSEDVVSPPTVQSADAYED